MPGDLGHLLTKSGELVAKTDDHVLWFGGVFGANSWFCWFLGTPVHAIGSAAVSIKYFALFASQLWFLIMH